MSTEQYFTRHAEAETRVLTQFPLRQYQQALCIPAYDETPAFLQHISAAASHYAGKVLLVLVINQPEDSTDNDNNARLARYLQTCPCVWQAENMMLVQYANYDILWIDRYSQGRCIPSRQGVGLARKIAADIAAWLIINHRIATHQFFCSDADVIFPDDYFSATLPAKNSAGVLDFRHISGGDANIDKATQLYEKSLHHYVNGLQRAGSMYAFHTIGSCLLLNATYYIKARGFPVRPAGEDFYLLNKLQKLAPVINLDPIVIAIESRLSSRVPFGTGPAVAKLLLQQEAAIFYHPNCFSVLSAWLAYLSDIATTGQYSNPQHQDIALQNCLRELDALFDITSTVQKLFANHKTPVARRQHLHQWFDGFKTLKAIHYLRDRHFPSITYNALQTQQEIQLKHHAKPIH